MALVSDESREFDFIITLVYERSRIRLHDGKQSLIRARLGKRMRHFGFSTLKQYCDYLRGPNGEAEIVHAIDSLTTNFTQFLREEKHFHFLVEQALPSLVGQKPRPFRVWSAACATGEEPYSLAIYLGEHYPVEAGWNWSIHATDISTKALGKASQGIYPEDRLSSLPPEWLRKYFQKGMRDWEGYFRVRPSMASRVKFQQLNLLGSYTFTPPFEVIFCRNVMIYFDRPTQEQLVNQLVRCLAPGGYLLVGHSESLAGITAPLRCLKPSIYRKE